MVSFQDLLKKECWEVPIINPISESLRKLKPAKEATFGTLLPFNGDMLVTYGNDVVYILDPVEMSVLASVSSLRRYDDFTCEYCTRCSFTVGGRTLFN